MILSTSHTLCLNTNFVGGSRRKGSLMFLIGWWLGSRWTRRGSFGGSTSLKVSLFGHFDKRPRVRWSSFEAGRCKRWGSACLWSRLQFSWRSESDFSKWGLDYPELSKSDLFWDPTVSFNLTFWRAQSLLLHYSARHPFEMIIGCYWIPVKVHH